MNSNGYRGPQVALDPFFEALCDFTEKNSNVKLLFNRVADLPVDSEMNEISGCQRGELRMNTYNVF